MNALLKKLWHDPVWSKVIAGLILGGLAIIGGLWSKSDFSPDFAIAWTAAKSGLGAVWAWLVAPIGIPAGIVLILVAGAISTEIRNAIVRQRRGRELAQEHQRAIAEREEARSALLVAQADIKEMQRIRSEEQAAAAKS